LFDSGENKDNYLMIRSY